MESFARRKKKFALSVLQDLVVKRKDLPLALSVLGALQVFNAKSVKLECTEEMKIEISQSASTARPVTTLDKKDSPFVCRAMQGVTRAEPNLNRVLRAQSATTRKKSPSPRASSVTKGSTPTSRVFQSA